MMHLRRILSVTLGLAIAGVVAGIVGVAVVPDDPLSLSFYGIYVGAPLSVITAPVVAWLLLRDVPFGRRCTGTALGTVYGTVAGWLLAPGDPDRAVIAVLGALAGFLSAAVLMSIKFRRVPA
jgi:hypothetical protein